MSKWLRRLGLAIFIVVVVSAAVLSVRDFSWKDRAYAERAQKAAQEYRDYANREIARCYQERAAEAAKCSDDAYNFYRQQYREEYNLAAQQTSAWWTKVAGAAAIFAGAVGTISIVLIFMTFWQTLKQAGEIEKSVRSAERSAAAMEGVDKSMAINAEKIVESVGISAGLARNQRLFGQMQMRAYISVLIGTGFYQDSNLRFEVRPKIINSGHTPAENVRWRIAIDVLPVPLPNNFQFALPTETVGGSILGPHQDAFMAAVLGFRIPEDEVPTVKAGAGRAVYVWGALQYWDVLGSKHWCTFAQQVYWEPTGDVREDGIVPQAMRGYYLPSHNRSN